MAKHSAQIKKPGQPASEFPISLFRMGNPQSTWLINSRCLSMEQIDAFSLFFER
jgi:hypothetical protein